MTQPLSLHARRTDGDLIEIGHLPRVLRLTPLEAQLCVTFVTHAGTAETVRLARGDAGTPCSREVRSALAELLGEAARPLSGPGSFRPAGLLELCNRRLLQRATALTPLLDIPR